MNKVDKNFNNNNISYPNHLGKYILEPYIGPRSFTGSIEDRKRFFGRDDETEEIVSLISGHKLVLIYAQSGAGKTSIFNAQVIPSLKQSGYDIIGVTRVKSSISSEKIDINHIHNVYIFNALHTLQPELDLNLIKDKSLMEFLKDSINKKKDNTRKQQILIFDQLEEIFSIFPKDLKKQRKDFFIQISEALNNISSLQIVFIIREDYLAQLDPYSNLLPEKLRPRFRLERLREDAALLAIKGPLENIPEDFIQNNMESIDEDIKFIIEQLMEIKVEYAPGKINEIEGEFIEPIQLQLVCQRWWENFINSDGKTRKQNKINVTDVDNALKYFYEKSIKEVTKKTGLSEGEVRKWCDENLITLSGTRNIIHTSGLKNDIVDILSKNYLIKENWLAGSKWYELTHDRLINPIRISNTIWKKEQEKRKKSKIKKILIASSVVVVILCVWYINQYDTPITNLIPAGELPYIASVNPTTGLVYLTNPKSDSISIINGKKNYLLDHIKVQDEPTGIAVDSKKNKVYVSHRLNNTISFIHLNHPFLFFIPPSWTSWIKSDITDIPINHTASFLAINSNTSKLYANAVNSNFISVIDTNNFNVTKIKVGNRPIAIDVDSSNNKIYVANSKDNSVSVIDGTTNKEITKIPVGKNPSSLAFNPNDNKVYVNNKEDNTVSVIDGTNYDVIKKIEVGKSPSSITINPYHNKIYVANFLDNTVSVIDGENNMAVATLNVGKRPTSIDMNMEQNILYVTNNLDNNVMAIGMNHDLPRKVLDTIPVGNNPLGLTKDNKTKMVYVANTDSNSVSVIDGKTNMKVKEFLVEEKPRDIAIHSKNGKIYVSNSLSDTISVIDLKKENLIPTHIFTKGNYPSAIAVNDNKNLIYVANTDSDDVSVIDGTTNKLLKEPIKVGNGPSGIAIDQKNNLIYVTNYQSDTVSIIDGKSKKIINGSIPLRWQSTYFGNGPLAIEIDENNNYLYIVNTFSDNVLIIDIKTIQDVLQNNNGTIDNMTKYITTNIPVGDSPTDISLDFINKQIYVTNSDEDNINRISIPSIFI
ncbi:MAG TPA: beta-propeller fold lactonase family protein [Nitrososphaeraceae archaeon]|nr:beta-propeller fold lactonase family protein [Nitrososphaeraceae archaeon]